MTPRKQPSVSSSPLGPVRLTGEAARQFTAYLHGETELPLASRTAIKRAVTSGRLLLTGAPVTLRSGVVIRYRAPPQAPDAEV